MTDTTTHSSNGHRVGGSNRGRRRRPILVELYSSSLGKKYVMALTGVAMIGYVVTHLLGWNNRHNNRWHRRLATTIAVGVVVGNLSFPLAVLTGTVGT